MEIQWNYETITGANASGKTSDIHNELRKVVTRIFENDNDYYDLDLVSKYQQVFEMVSFMFEDYRHRFEKIMEKRMGDLTQEQLQVEVLVFCYWVSIEVMTALSKQVVRT